jgi:N-ethylmaleimide reductase
MNAPASLLFQPLQMGALKLPNRIAMAPLTRNRAGPGNVPQALNVEYYRQRASAGLIITEATQICPEGLGYPNTPGIHTKAQVAGWKAVTDAVHEAGGRIVIQLWHVGRISHPSLQPDGKLPVAPSAIRPAGKAMTFDGMQDFVTPRALDAEEIPGIIEQYRRAAENAKRAGFDGVEVHCANGYLPDQFLRDGTNQRTDEWGGSLENRMRFPTAVLEAVLSVWPANRVGIRLSPSGTASDMHDSNPETTFGTFIDRLNGYGLAYLHLMDPSAGDLRHGGHAVPARSFRSRYQGPIMVNTDYDGAKAHAALAQNEADLVSFGRLFIANPDLPERLAQHAPLNTPDVATFYGGDEKGYTDYPTLSVT